MIPSQNVIIAGPANFSIISVDSPTQFTCVFLGLDGDVAAASVISIGAEVSPSGRPGFGQNAFAVTTSNFTVPSVGSNVTVPVDDSTSFVVGEYAVATGPANFKVASVPNSTSLTLTFLGNTGDVSPGATVLSGSIISPTGIAGQNAFTTLTAQITIPAVGSTVNASVISTDWIAVNQKLVIDGPASFQATVINSHTSVTLKFLGYVGDLAPSNTISNGAKVSPSGTQPETGATVSVGLGSPFVIPVTTPTSAGISVTIPNAGTWKITAFMQIIFSDDYNGYNGENPVVFTIQRLNNTTTALVNLTCYPPTGTNPSSGSRVTWGVFPIQLAAYTTSNTNDQIGIFASYQHTLGAGTLSIQDISLVCEQIS